MSVGEREYEAIAVEYLQTLRPRVCMQKSLVHNPAARKAGARKRYGVEIMNDPRQERLSVENPGKISPPEPGLYLGTSGWSYGDWEGSLYPEGLPPGARLAEYAGHYATSERDSTFYGSPRASTVQKWREVVPESFLFAAKFPQEIPTYETKEGSGVGGNL